LIKLVSPPQYNFSLLQCNQIGFL